MALQSITVTFPKYIKPEKIIKIIEGNMKANSNYECQCHFKGFDGQENVYVIWAEQNEAFYLIGMTAAGILEKYGNNS